MLRYRSPLRRSSSSAPAETIAMLPPNAHALLEIALRTGVIYCLVLIGIRLSGKREVGQMTPFDLTLLLLLSNSGQNAMTGPDTSLAGAAVGGRHSVLPT